MQSDTRPRLVSAQELAQEYGISRSMIYTLIRRGTIRDFYRVGRQLRFDPDAVREQLREEPAS